MLVKWTTEALSHLEAIKDHIAIEKQNPPAAFALVEVIYNKTNTALSEFPNRGREGRVEGTREFVISGTAFIVAYRIKENVEILAVQRGSQQWPQEFS